MKKFIHENFLESNPDIKISDLPESIQKKIETWNTTKKDVYAMRNTIKRNEHLPELEIMSNDIMEEIRDEYEPDEPPEEPPVKEPEKPVDPPVTEPEKPADPPAPIEDDSEKKPKKKSGNALAWIIGGILVAVTGAAIISEVKSQKKDG